MIRYKVANQMTIEEFKTPFQTKLNPENRWVRLSREMPWDEMAGIYYKSMSTDKGAPGIDARIVIGAIIIKHIERLDDRRTIAHISENPYMQYFLGLSNFTDEPVFDPSLFVRIRRRLGVDEFNAMTELIIKLAMERSVKHTPAKKSKVKGNDKKEDKSTNEKQQKEAESEPKKNHGKLQMDATVANAYIKYPTDLDLLNDSREKSEELIDGLSAGLNLKTKPRTYRRVARRRYLLIAKKKNKSRKEIRKGIRQQLGYLGRNIKHIHNLLDEYQEKRKDFPLTRKTQKYFFVIQHVYDQQKQMYQNREHSCTHRIVSIHQPHVRPIVRGKAKANVEFGAKIGVSLVEGFGRIDTFSWEAYNESSDLKKQVENYEKNYGCYPELVQVDGIYLNRENRKWLKERNIRYTGKPLGRPPEIEQTKYQKQKSKKEKAERNQIEGKFGQGKNGYELGRIRARLSETSKSWIASIMFVMNLVKYKKVVWIMMWMVLNLVWFIKDFIFAYFWIHLKKQILKLKTEISELKIPISYFSQFNI